MLEGPSGLGITPHVSKSWNKFHSTVLCLLAFLPSHGFLDLGLILWDGVFQNGAQKVRRGSEGGEEGERLREYRNWNNVCGTPEGSLGPSSCGTICCG